MLIGRREHIEDATARGHLSASLDEIDTLLNKQSGLLGCAGTGSGDMRELVAAAAAGKESAVTTLNMVGHRAALYIGGYYTLLGGADAIIFTGGVGENSFPAREAIISRLVAIGCRLDPARNKQIIFGKQHCRLMQRLPSFKF
jgi:acetate kinase